MRIDELLRPDRVLCRREGLASRAVLQDLAICLERTGVAIPPAELIDMLDRRRHADPLPLGKGIVVYHLRTERVPELTIALATCPAGVEDLKAPDDLPIRAVTVFLAPKRHAELYLTALASMVKALSVPEVMERVAAAERPEQAILAFRPDEGDMERGQVLSLLSQEGALQGNVAHLLERMAPEELADLLEDVPPRGRGRCLSALQPARAAEVTRLMPLVPLAATLRRMPPDAAARVLALVPSSRCADILQRMQPSEQGAILKHLGNGTHRDIQTLLKYPPHTAGGIMTPEVLSVQEGATVAEALRAVATFKDRRQTGVYMTAPDGRLLGWCQFHDLAGADGAQPAAAFLKRSFPSAPPERDQEELLRLLANNEAQAIAVVGKDGKLLGVVTEDALLAAMDQEANEDLHQIVGMKVVDPLHTPTMVRMRLRLPWLLLTLTGELMIALAITTFFKETLERAAVLAAFIPAIMATGGNVGLQATAMVIRSLAMGSIKHRHAVRIVLGEMKAGILLGLGCGAVASLAAYAINWGSTEVLKVSLAVFLAMLSATLATSLAGTAVPIALHRFKLDPATACGPFVTMFNDMFGSLVYLFIAMRLFAR